MNGNLLNVKKAKGGLPNMGVSSQNSSSAKQNAGIGNQATLNILGGGMSVKDRARLFEAGVKKPAAGKAASVPAYGGKSIKERLKMFESLSSIPESGVEQQVLLIKICKVFSPDDSAMRSLLRSASVKMKMCDDIIHDKKKRKAAKTNIFSQLVHSTSFDDAKSMLDTIDVEWFFNFR